MSVSPTNGNGPTQGQRKTGPFPLVGLTNGREKLEEKNWPISINRANTHMVFMGRKLALHITL